MEASAITQHVRKGLTLPTPPHTTSHAQRLLQMCREPSPSKRPVSYLVCIYVCHVLNVHVFLSLEVFLPRDSCTPTFIKHTTAHRVWWYVLTCERVSVLAALCCNPALLGVLCLTRSTVPNHSCFASALQHSGRRKCMATCVCCQDRLAGANIQVGFKQKRKNTRTWKVCRLTNTEVYEFESAVVLCSTDWDSATYAVSSGPVIR